MTDETKPAESTGKKFNLVELSQELVGLIDGYELTPAEAVAALEVAKTTVVMDCVSTLIASAHAEDILADLGIEIKAKGHTVN